jgi:hypothetical protein
MKTRSQRDLQPATQSAYNIASECGRSCIGETGRPLSVRFHGHRHNLKEGLLEKSKLTQSANEEGHKVG